MEICGVLFLYLTHPAHPGSGSSVGAIDQPIQRERITGYPMIQSAGVKGALKAEIAARGLLANDVLTWLFGPDPPRGEETQDGTSGGNTTARDESSRSAISITDARTLLFPVASASGVFGWTTSGLALARLARDLVSGSIATQATRSLTEDVTSATDARTPSTQQYDAVQDTGILDVLGQLSSLRLTPPNGVATTEYALWAGHSPLTLNQNIYLEERAFLPAANRDDETSEKHLAELGGLTRFLQQNAIPTVPDYFRDQLPVQTALLPDNAFRDFVQFATQIETHVALNPAKRVAAGPWDVELLPAETLMYCLVSWKPAIWLERSAEEASDRFISDVAGQLQQMQIGGLETLGRGLVALRYHPVVDLINWQEETSGGES